MSFADILFILLICLLIWGLLWLVNRGKGGRSSKD